MITIIDTYRDVDIDERNDEVVSMSYRWSCKDDNVDDDERNDRWCNYCFELSSIDETQQPFSA